jgi:hypothetical protein
VIIDLGDPTAANFRMADIAGHNPNNYEVDLLKAVGGTPGEAAGETN